MVSSESASFDLLMIEKDVDEVTLSVVNNFKNECERDLLFDVKVE